MSGRATEQFWWQTEDNLVRLHIALEQAMPDETPPILCRVGEVLADAEYAGLRAAFGLWACQSWTKENGLLDYSDAALRVQLGQLAAAGELEAMGSLAIEKWKERERQREAQIRTRAMERGMEQGLSQGRAEGIEFHRRQLGSLAARRFGADAGERLSALLAGVTEPERLAAVGNAIIDSGTGAELLAAVRRIVGVVNSAG